ncbi:uncharacterized protein EAF01_001988 [Botrytis porri]|uniref:Uncharacterized protein n=1 Tax=Botrytis porri TaxID=87229 RepID=A0A4Z1KCK3_9HELO|nr:uncharacterized protein EAF01_001988 [Botrytis porri]KAF7912967.1 hypothetical protein EAF01_001988 [Botrytis porri]TGO83078.1 hypothetical protein BPOR_0706g00030 [Botrytis porri]
MALNDIESEGFYRLFRYRFGGCRALKIRPTDKQSLLEYVSARYPASELGAILEPLIAMISATVTTRYTLYHEQGRINPSNKPMSYTINSGSLGVVLDPYALSLLASCILLGYSISSFTHRRQGHDRCQSFILVSAILMATTIGFGLGIDSNLIMLGFIPWALILAMVLSVFIHWTARRHRRPRDCPGVFLLEKIGKPIMPPRLEETHGC